jgi:CheY-like chemotaxis protein
MRRYCQSESDTVLPMDEPRSEQPVFPLRVLIVDDEPDMVLSTSILLRIHGYEVFTAGNGRDALDLVASEQPHVVILDLAMPGLSGLALAKAIRESVIYRRPFLIAHTGVKHRRIFEDVRAAGIDLLMFKPAPFDDLKSVLDRFAPLVSEGWPAEEEGSTNVPSLTVQSVAARAEASLRVQLLASEKQCKVRCCLCGRYWEVQGVEVELLDQTRRLGVICPACLRLRPGYIAAQMEEEAQKLADNFCKLQSCLGLQTYSRPISTDPEAIRAAMMQVRVQTERLRNGCRAIRQHSIQLRELNRKSRREISLMQERHKQLMLESRLIKSRRSDVPFVEFASHLSEAVERFEEAIVLADHLKSLTSWPVSLTQLIEEERHCVSRRSYGLTSADLRRLVDQRYEDFFRCSA